MPIISRIGARSMKVRLIYGGIYAVLAIGAITTIYPLSLMLSGSLNSAADDIYVAPYPRFWFNDTILFHKYVESKYNGSLDAAEAAWHRKIGSWRNIKPADPQAPPPHFDAYLRWRSECPWWELGHAQAGMLYAANARQWRGHISRENDGDIATFRQRYGIQAKSWSVVVPPPAPATRYPPDSAYRRAYGEYAATRPIFDRIIANLDGLYAKSYLQPRYTATIAEYNRTHGTAHRSYEDLFLDSCIPGSEADDRDWADFLRDEMAVTNASALRADQIDIPERHREPFRSFLRTRFNGDIASLNRKYKVAATGFDPLRLRIAREEWQDYVLASFRQFLRRRHGGASVDNAPILALVREDWQDYVRNALAVRFIRLDPELAPSFRRFVLARHGDLDRLNQAYGTRHRSTDDIEFSAVAPAPAEADARLPARQRDWDAFLKDRSACPSGMLAVHGPRQAFEDYLRKTGAAIVPPVRLPLAHADFVDCTQQASALRREFTARNYLHVLEYILFHGRGAVNTLIYVVLSILTHLLVNPLAAYALSRYKLPSTYQILLFCMATMAFPGEVTMIPNFLLLRKFPLWPLIAGGLTFLAALWLMGRTARRVPELLRALIALLVAVAVGAGLVPCLMTGASVSLLNTFAALVLPGMASGFSIFLLKGFFDSLPVELYEAATIDGASELRMFWTLTMSLSKPILAVMALGAFTSAYGDFMFAMVKAPDQSMWTLMVWIFQLRTQSHQAVMYASLVLAAIPTLLVFIFCQNLIIRGIIVPSEK